jgi:hypothetical protein
MTSSSDAQRRDWPALMSRRTTQKERALAIVEQRPGKHLGYLWRVL